MAHRGRRRQRACGAGGVEDAVVRAAQKFAHADADFVTHNRGSQQLATAGANGLRHRHRRRKHDGGRVKHRAVVHIVLLGHMRCGRIGHGGQVGAGARAVNDHLAGTGGRAHGLRKALDGFHRTGTVSCHSRTEPVHQQVFGLAHDRLGNVFKTQLRSKGGKAGGGRCHGRILGFSIQAADGKRATSSRLSTLPLWVMGISGTSWSTEGCL